MNSRSRYEDICDALTAWHPDARASRIFSMPCVKRSGRVVFGSTDADRRLRRRVVLPPEQADAWEELAYTARAQDHSLGPA